MSTAGDPIFEGVPIPALRLSREGKILAFNKAARKVFAIEPDRAIDKPILGLVVPEERARIRDFFLRVLQGQRTEWTTRFRRGDAATRVQRVCAIPHTEGASVTGILVFTTDVTSEDGKGPEAAQMHALLENLPGQFTAVLDAQGRVRTSTGFARTHFKDDADLVGEPLATLFGPDGDGEASVATLLAAVKQGDHWTGIHAHERADELVFPVRTFASPWIDRQDGRVLGALVIGRDATVEHRWRERAQRAERLGAVGEYAAGISSAFAAGLARVEHERDAERLRVELASLHAFAESVRQLAEDSSPDRGPVDLREVVGQVVADLRGRLTSGGITVTASAPEAVPAVQANRGAMVRLLRILLENSVDSVEAAGGGWIRIALSAEPQGVVVRVSDSGKALPEETLHRVFEPFFTTKPGRHGLGLSVARALVRGHEGHIWTDHDEEGHVVFAVQLPTGAEADEKATFRPVPLSLSQGRAILVVDDEESVRLSMRRFLERVGYDVREAWSGRSALAQITGGRRPELVLTDLRMRDGSGFWFLQELERDFPDLLRKTVIVTGDPEHAEVKRLVMRTGCPVIGKPVELPELLELLDEVARVD